MASTVKLMIGVDGVPHLMASMMNLRKDQQRQLRFNLADQPLRQRSPQAHALDTGVSQLSQITETIRRSVDEPVGGEWMRGRLLHDGKDFVRSSLKTRTSRIVRPPLTD